MTENRIYEVLIIGGGLAGLALAIQLAKAKYHVLVLEKDDYPRHKVCGEYISMESKPFLESLGLPISSLLLPVINELLITDTKGTSLQTKLPQGGFGISRYMLDNALAELAKKEGATLLTRAKVDSVHYDGDQFTVYAAGAQYKAKVACGSWGKRSSMDVKLQRSFISAQHRTLNNYIGVKYHIKYPWPDQLIALHNFKNGYCGISKIEEDTCCLCYLTTTDNLQRSGNDIKVMEQQILMKNLYLREIFQKAAFLYDQPLTISQISFERKEQVQDHILLLGDAAGLITPLCGNGMSMAFHASKIAYKAINDMLQKRISYSQMEHEYLRDWQKHFAKRLSMGRFLQGRLGKETATTLFLQTMKMLPFLQKPVIAASSGKPF